MTRTLSFIAILGLLSGCPTPPETTTAGPGGPGAAPGGNAGGPPPGGNAGGPPPGGNAGGPPPGGEAGGGTAGGPPPADGPPEKVAPPTFPEADKTVTLKVKVVGGTVGQIDFMTIDGEFPKALHVHPFEGEGPHEITAPATLGEPLYMGAMNYANGKTIGQGDEMGLYKEAIKLSGKDLSLTVKIGDKADWMPEPPEGADQKPPKPPGDAPGQMGGPGGGPGQMGGAPAGGAPAGGAPAGGAPAGGAPAGGAPAGDAPAGGAPAPQ